MRFSKRRLGFNAREMHVLFVVDRMALEQVSLLVLNFSRQSSFYQKIYIHLSSPSTSGAGTIGPFEVSVPMDSVPFYS
jgi:hypothetical protein